MKLLVEGHPSGNFVVPANFSVKKSFGGKSKVYPVYRISLEKLLYNEQNSRIATSISQVLEKDNKKDFSEYTLEEKREILHNLIRNSSKDPKTFENTKNSILEIGQTEPGVVSNDGIIIDGNRRYTCLLELQEKDQQFRFFNAVIFDEELEVFGHDKQLKLFELREQRGKDKQVDYDPIDKLVDIYNSVIKSRPNSETPLVTKEEYRESCKLSKVAFNTDCEVTLLLVDFLKYINAEGKFYIAKHLYLDGPLRELENILKGISGDAEKNRVKHIAFCHFYTQSDSKMTPYIRKLRNIIKSERKNEFLNQSETAVEEILEKLPQGRTTTIEDIDEIHKDNIVDKLTKPFDETMDKINAKKSCNEPEKNINKALTLLSGIDTKKFSKISKTDLEKIKQECNSIKEVVSIIEKDLNV
jgi:hypothetical protein